MKKRFLWILTICTIASANEMNGQIEAQWQLNKAWQQEDAIQNWTSANDWQTELSAEISLSLNGLGLELALTPNQVQMDELYVDFSSRFAEWTVGQKPQTWAYSYSAETLNWIGEKPMVMREQYLPWSTLQTYCAKGNSNTSTDCGLRVSGWGDLEWQVMARVEEHVSTGGGLQSTVNDSFLIYSEALFHHQKTGLGLQELAPEIVTINEQKQDDWEANAGIQVSTQNGTTLHYEWHYDAHQLNATQWSLIEAQLTTPNAGLIASALQSPSGEHQHLLRLSQQWKQWDAEAVLVYWPDAGESILYQASLSRELSSRLSFQVQWQDVADHSMLAKIGQGTKIEMGLRFSDGF